MRGHRRLGGTVLSGLVLLGGATLALAAAGALDTGYGDGGVGVVSAASGSQASALVVQSGGQSVLAGWNGAGAWQLTRFSASGAVESGFASSAASIPGRAIALTLDGDDLVAGGTLEETVTSGKGKNATTTVVYRPAVARWLADGTLDTGFGTGGVATLAVSGGYAVRSLEVLSTGKIVVAGSATAQGSGRKAPTSGAWFVARLLSGGSARHDVRIGRVRDLQPDRPRGRRPGQRDRRLGGRIHRRGGRTGWDSVHGTGRTSTVARFSSSGALQAVMNRASEYMPDLALDGSGKLVAGSVAEGQTQLKVTRYDLSSGGIATDTIFGSSGTATINAPSGGAFVNGWASVAVGPTGRIVAAYVPGSGADAWVAGLTGAGSVDSTFGTSGFAGPIDAGTGEFNTMVAFDDSGRLLIGGCAFGPSASVDWFVARLLAD